MASAFNKVYKALTNIDHENVRRFWLWQQNNIANKTRWI
jgi:hypothetical protein